MSIALLAALYLLQAATPLRLDDDTVDYLNMASAITDGQPVPSLRLPDGYPHIVSALERLGMGASAFFVLTNCAFLAIGFYSFWRLRDYSTPARSIAILTSLLAIPFVKSVPIALPDAAFFGTSMLVIALLVSADKREGLVRTGLVVGASLFSVVAISMRYAGIALIPTLLWVLMHPHFAPDRTRAATSRLLLDVAVTIMITVAAGALFFKSRVFTQYIGDAQAYYANSSALQRVLYRLMVAVRSAGEIAVNLPFSRFRSFGNVFLMVGIFATGAVVILLRNRERFSVPRVFLFFYLLMIVAWPNPAPRLWMPVMPLIAAEMYQVLSSRTNRPMTRRAVQAYSVWFCLTGLAAIGYSTRISLSGERFTRVYGRAGGMADPTIKPGDPSWSHVQYYRETAERLLARYGDKRARGK